MKIKKGIFAGMAVMALLFGFVLAGCASVKTISEETETSREILAEAVDLVNSHGGKIKVSDLVSGLANKFPGLKLPSVTGIQVNVIQVSYGGTAKWPTTYRIMCTMGEGEVIEGTGGGVRQVGGDTIVTSITSVIENRVIEE